MKYKLIKPINENYSALEQVLTNRGIPKEKIKNYLMTTDDVIHSYNLLGEEALKEAAMKIAKCVRAEANALVIVDSDCDGFTSSAVLINYLYDLFPAWVENHLTWFMHEGKQHGLSDLSLEPESVGLYKLIIIPDASSNDYKYHEELHEQGINIVVLDHHEAERISPYATIINNQLSDYPNKEMSGVGIVWQFCKYMDNLMGVNYADNYLDLVALGMDADMMSLTSFETKHLINKGFQEEYVKNPFFSAICDKHSFSMKGQINPMSVAFYVAPYVNAIVRSGTMQEKEIVFQSMLKFKAFEQIPSNKRGHRPGEMEQLYLQAMRTVTNVKNRQTRAQDAGMAYLEGLIEEHNLLESNNGSLEIINSKSNDLIKRSYEILDITTDMVSGYDSSKTGIQILTVNYKGFNAQLTVIVRLKADFDGDGNIRANDITILRKALLSELSDDLEYDINNDRKCNLKDMVYIKKIVAGLI